MLLGIWEVVEPFEYPSRLAKNVHSLVQVVMGETEALALAHETLTKFESILGEVTKAQYSFRKTIEELKNL